MHAGTKEGLAKHLEEIRDFLRKTRERGALSVKAGELEKGLVALQDAHNENQKKIEGLESQVASDAKDNALLAMLENDHHSNCLGVTADSGELRRRVNVMEENTFDAVSSAKQLPAKFSAMTEEDALSANCKGLTLEV